MPEEKEKGVQQEFLDELKENGGKVKVFITNGFQLSGKIKGYDRFCIIIENEFENKRSLVYKSAISTITF